MAGVCVWQHVWQEASVVGGHAWQGGVHGRYYEIRSMSGRYASYWNAFLWYLRAKAKCGKELITSLILENDFHSPDPKKI